MKKLCLILSAVLFLGASAANAARTVDICVNNKTSQSFALVKLCADSYSQGSTVYSGYCRKFVGIDTSETITIHPPQKAHVRVCFLGACKNLKINVTESTNYDLTVKSDSKDDTFRLRETSDCG